MRSKLFPLQLFCLAAVPFVFGSDGCAAPTPRAGQTQPNIVNLPLVLRDSPPPAFIASIDTMKGSRDTQTRPWSDAAIAAEVNLAATLNTTHITVDTNWDYPDYVQRWVSAVRAAGKHAWFRGHPNQWENNNGATGIMTPADYKVKLRDFILAHPSLFESGDIFDACPEPEQGHYWSSKYGSGWTNAYPNAATREYNQFIRDTSDIADAAFGQLGIHGVITTIHSMNSWIGSHPGALESATAAKMGRVTIDSYPEGGTTDPQTARDARLAELAAVENAFHLPIVIGEMGYSDQVIVDDHTQQRVLKAELEGIGSLPYVVALNYWVGAGTDRSGGHTHIFTGSPGNWSLRPAAYELTAFFAFKQTGP